MEEQVAVRDAVHRTMGEDNSNVALETLADTEGAADAVDEFSLSIGECIGMLWIDGGEIGVAQWVILAVKAYDATLKVTSREEVAVPHAPLGMTLVELPLKLKCDDGNGFVHTGIEESLALGGFFLAMAEIVGHKDVAGIIGVSLEGEGGEGHEVDAVAFLEDDGVAVAKGKTEDSGYAAAVAGGSTHPEDIVVAPLDVEVVELAEAVHNEVGAGATIEDVAENVKSLDGEALDDVAEGCNKMVGTTSIYNGADDGLVVAMLVGVIGALVEEFLDDVGVFLGKAFAHLGASVFCREVAADEDEIIKRTAIEFIVDVHLLMDELELLFGVIDKRTEVLPFFFIHRGDAFSEEGTIGREEFVDAALDAS